MVGGGAQSVIHRGGPPGNPATNRFTGLTQAIGEGNFDLNTNIAFESSAGDASWEGTVQHCARRAVGQDIVYYGGFHEIMAALQAMAAEQRMADATAAAGVLQRAVDDLLPLLQLAVDAAPAIAPAALDFQNNLVQTLQGLTQAVPLLLHGPPVQANANPPAGAEPAAGAAPQ